MAQVKYGNGLLVHVFGASGAGSSTLGAEMERQGDMAWLDTDDYFWLPDEPPFAHKRPREARNALMLDAVRAAGDCVVTGNVWDWGNELPRMITHAVWVTTPTEERMRRLEQREYGRFGPRIRPGGDMYEEHMEFMEWAAGFEQADDSERSRAYFERHLAAFGGPVLEVDGQVPPAENAKRVLGWITKR